MANKIQNSGVSRLLEELKMMDSPICSRIIAIENYILLVEQENRDLKPRKPRQQHDRAHA